MFEIFWNIIDFILPIALIYYIYENRKLSKRLNDAIQRLFDETVNKMNGDDNVSL